LSDAFILIFIAHTQHTLVVKVTTISGYTCGARAVQAIVLNGAEKPILASIEVRSLSDLARAIHWPALIVLALRQRWHGCVTVNWRSHKFTEPRLKIAFPKDAIALVAIIHAVCIPCAVTCWGGALLAHTICIAIIAYQARVSCITWLAISKDLRYARVELLITHTLYAVSIQVRAILRWTSCALSVLASIFLCAIKPILARCAIRQCLQFAQAILWIALPHGAWVVCWLASNLRVLTNTNIAIYFA
jgi:hypothetical protein